MYIIVKFKPDQLNIYLRRLQQNKLDQQNSFVVILYIYKTYQRLIELILYIIISIYFFVCYCCRCCRRLDYIEILELVFICGAFLGSFCVQFGSFRLGSVRCRSGRKKNEREEEEEEEENLQYI